MSDVNENERFRCWNKSFVAGWPQPTRGRFSGVRRETALYRALRRLDGNLSPQLLQDHMALSARGVHRGTVSSRSEAT
jgi:hypothetical protein